MLEVDGVLVGKIGEVVFTRDESHFLPESIVPQRISDLCGGFNAAYNVDNLAAVFGTQSKPTIQMKSKRHSVDLVGAEVLELDGGVFEITCDSAQICIQATPKELRVIRRFRRHCLARDCRRRMRAAKLDKLQAFLRTFLKSSDYPKSLINVARSKFGLPKIRASK